MKLFAAVGLVVFVSACGGSSAESQPVVQGGNAYGPPPQQQPGMGPVPVQQGVPYGAQGVAPTVPTTPPPSPLSPACTEMTAPVVCGTHRCNPQNGRCALPCGSNMDCNPGFSCLGAGGPTAICVPGG